MSFFTSRYIFDDLGNLNRARFLVLDFFRFCSATMPGLKSRGALTTRLLSNHPVQKQALNNEKKLSIVQTENLSFHNENLQTSDISGQTLLLFS